MVICRTQITLHYTSLKSGRSNSTFMEINTRTFQEDYQTNGSYFHKRFTPSLKVTINMSFPVFQSIMQQPTHFNSNLYFMIYDLSIFFWHCVHSTVPDIINDTNSPNY